MTTLRQWRTVYKLTDAKGKTFKSTQWGPGVTNPCGILTGGTLCSGGYYHAYHTPELAVFLNTIGANCNPDTMRLWEAEIRGTVAEDRGVLKLGATQMRTVREVDCPRPTTVQRVAFAILCAQSGYTDAKWHRWANGWLDGRDRSANSAHRACSAVRSAHRACSAVRSADNACSAASSADNACSAASSADNAYSAASSAYNAVSTYSATAAAIIDASVWALAQSWED